MLCPLATSMAGIQYLDFIKLLLTTKFLFTSTAHSLTYWWNVSQNDFFHLVSTKLNGHNLAVCESINMQIGFGWLVKDNANILKLTQ
jgi:hypothetical protein